MQLGSPSGPPPATTRELLSRLHRSPRPALTQYGDGAAPFPGTSPVRVELSGKVIAQWAYKCANLLWEEGVGEGDLLTLDASPTWRALPWALGAWLQGVSLATLPQEGAVTVTDRPEGAVGGLVVALPHDPLALAWGGELPPSVLDGAADVASQADLPLGSAEPAESSVALADAGIRFGDLYEVIGVGASRRVLVEASSTWDLVRRSVAAWRAGGGVVVVNGVDGEALERIRTQEGL